MLMWKRDSLLAAKPTDPDAIETENTLFNTCFSALIALSLKR